MPAPLTVAAAQFAGSSDPTRNAQRILTAMEQAARRGACLLVTHECALSGYAGVDIESPRAIDRRALRAGEEAIRERAAALSLAVCLGSTRFRAGKAYNTLCLIDGRGRTRAVYAKRALYGGDPEHYAPGTANGVAAAGLGFRLGLRVCFEFRFPEYFRELLQRGVALAAIAFSMVGPTAAKLAIARAHLMSRAAENGLAIVAANNLNGVSNAPTCIIDADGRILREAGTRRAAVIAAPLDLTPAQGLRGAIRRHARRLSAPQ